jgi:predicted O-linked N-acetylglucosamine transferase (SPINDLY family)
LWRQAIEQRPEDSAAFGNLGQLLAETGDEAEARAIYLAGARRHGTAALKILEATTLPVILESEEQIQACRRRLSENLDHLLADKVQIDTSRECLPTLFYLAYHGCDDRPLMEKMARLSSQYQRGPQLVMKRPSGKRLRIGVLSHFLRDHTIGRLNVGLIEQLSRDKFEVFAIACQPAEDALTTRIKRVANQYVVLPGAVPAALDALRDMHLDILWHADIGMIPFTYTLAHNRVAPVQCATWGHPVTSGLPTIDYFISSDALETPGSEQFYTEKLIRLPRLSVCYDRPLPPNPSASREQFGLKQEEHLYACPQTLFKFHPRFDPILAEILRKDPRSRLVLLEGRHPQWQQRLVARWQKAMPDVVERITFLPKLPRQKYLDLLQVSDVILDTVEFSGGNSSYEAFGLHRPVVTLPSSFLRSRLTAAMYTQMGLGDRVAESPGHYVGLATRLASDPAYAAEWSQALAGNSESLWEDMRAFRNLEQVLQELRA